MKDVHLNYEKNGIALIFRDWIYICSKSFIFFWENFHQITKKAQNHVKIRWHAQNKVSDNTTENHSNFNASKWRQLFVIFQCIINRTWRTNDRWAPSVFGGSIEATFYFKVPEHVFSIGLLFCTLLDKTVSRPLPCYSKAFYVTFHWSLGCYSR